MSGAIERGPLQTFEVMYTSGHVERFQAHQALMPSAIPHLFGVANDRAGRWNFHGEFDGQWMLVLSIPEAHVVSVRNVTQTVDDLGGAR